MSTEHTDHQHRTLLASRLDHLLRTVQREVTDAEHERDLAAGGDATLPRRRRPWYLNELATKIGVTPSYLSYLIRGQRDNPKLNVVRALADVFDVPVSYLVDDEVTNTGADVDRRLALQQRIQAPDTDASLAERLNTLFDSVRAGEHEATNAELAEAVGCTAADIQRLRDGTIGDQAELGLLRRVAGYFGVPVVYLLGETDPTAAHVDNQLALLRDWRERGILDLTLSLNEISSAESMQQIAQIIETFLQIESKPKDLRLSNDERQQAVDGLAAHAESGRLSPAEYEQRAEDARHATLRSDLDPLFGDLPDPKPAFVDTRRRPRRGQAALT